MEKTRSRKFVAKMSTRIACICALRASTRSTNSVKHYIEIADVHTQCCCCRTFKTMSRSVRPGTRLRACREVQPCIPVTVFEAFGFRRNSTERNAYATLPVWSPTWLLFSVICFFVTIIWVRHATCKSFSYPKWIHVHRSICIDGGIRVLLSSK